MCSWVGQYCIAIIAAKDIANIALEYFAVVNKAEHHTRSVSWVNVKHLISSQEYIGFSIIPDVVHSILQYPSVIFSNISQYIAHAILLTCENVCDNIIAWT